jgi:hypothetical protein
VGKILIPEADPGAEGFLERVEAELFRQKWRIEKSLSYSRVAKPEITQGLFGIIKDDISGMSSSTIP